MDVKTVNVGVKFKEEKETFKGSLEVAPGIKLNEEKDVPNMEPLTEIEKGIHAWRNICEAMKNENGEPSIQISLEGSPFLDVKLKNMNEETKKKFWEFWDSFQNQLQNSELSLPELLEFFYFR